MARDRSPIVKQSRREGYALHPKAHKIMVKKSTPPGQHGRSRQPKQSLYAQQLREKQKVRRLYGLMEKQFAKLMKEAARSKSQSGELLLLLLERRLDNAVYRAGFAPSRRGSRQLVTHGHFLLNGRRVDVPSIRLKQGDEISLRPKSKSNNYFKQIEQINKETSQQAFGWLKTDLKKVSIVVTGSPKREEVEDGINEQLIVEYYSR